ncbi:MAG: hypothetical protein R2909_15165 [Gemmatimonadales bacterium]
MRAWRCSRRWLLATAALVFHVWAAILVPVAHAEREVLWTAASWESHHTSSCPIIHSDDTCPALGHVPMPLVAVRGSWFAELDAPSAGPASTAPLRSDSLPNAHRTRAPPLA